MEENKKSQVIIVGAGATGKTIIMEALKKEAEAKGMKVVVFKPSEEQKQIELALSAVMPIIKACAHHYSILQAFQPQKTKGKKRKKWHKRRGT